MSQPVTSAEKDALNVFHDLHLTYVREERGAPERSIRSKGEKASAADMPGKAVSHPTAHAAKLVRSR